MYNRYIRNDNGQYTRITEDDGESRRPPNAPPPQASGTPRHSPRNPAPGPSDAPPHGPAQPPHDSAPPPMPPDPPPRSPNPPRRPPPPPSAAPLQDALRGFLQRLLNAAHMENTDTGDLLTLCLLYILYREGADEELLAALGLLLIL